MNLTLAQFQRLGEVFTRGCDPANEDDRAIFLAIREEVARCIGEAARPPEYATLWGRVPAERAGGVS